MKRTKLGRNGARTTSALIDNESGSPEMLLSAQDTVLEPIILSDTNRWPSKPTEDPIWGLFRIVMAQQISTRHACRLAEKVRTAYPSITRPSSQFAPRLADLRAFGLSERRAQCCITILRKSDELRDLIARGESWESRIASVKGIGPWTLAVFRIMVLREPDVLPLGDVGLARAIVKVYGPGRGIEELAENWRPYRSVACWYLWRTLGNEQLG